MSIIAGLQIYLKGYAKLKVGAPVWVDHLGAQATKYAIIPLAGEQIVKAYLNGVTIREYPFAFRSMESTADDLERLENSGFYEDFAAWLEAQTDAGNLPTLATGQTAKEILATGWAYLYEQGQSETGVYQIMCKLVYKQQP